MSVSEIGPLLVQTNQPSVFTIVAVSLRLTTIVYKINVQRTQISDVIGVCSFTSLKDIYH